MSVEHTIHPKIFPERPAINIDTPLEILAADPEIELTSSEKEMVLQAEKMFTRGTDLSGEGVKGIEHSYIKKVNSVEFYADYFLTHEGRQALDTIIDDHGITEESGLYDVREALSKIEYSQYPSDKIDRIAGASKNFVIHRMVNQFKENNFSSTEGIENPLLVTIIKNPEELAEKLEGYSRFKTYIKEYKRTLNGRGDNTGKALSVVVEIHHRRINQLIAETYPLVAALIHQSRTSGRDTDIEAVSTIQRTIGEHLLHVLGNGDESEKTFERLDKFINGVDDTKKDGVYSVLSPEAIRLAQEAESKIPQKAEDYVFKNVDQSVIDSTVIDADMWRKWAKKSLYHYGLLSEEDESTWSTDRKGPASDGKIQVVPDHTRKALAYDDSQRVLKQPADFHRPISAINGGGIPILNHEIAHVIQNNLKRKVGLGITEKVGMDRAIIYAEAGAVSWEAQSQAELFGNIIPADSFYLRAAQARIAGGTLRECAKAFYDSALNQDPDADKQKIMELAVDRSMRLFRNGARYNDRSGHLTNSQPLVYLEQEIIARKLSEKGKSEYLMIGGTNLQMLAELHRVGLLDLSQIELPTVMPSDIVMEDIKELLGVS